MTEAEPVHPGVDLQVAAQAGAAGTAGGAQRLGGAGARDRRRQVVAEHAVDVADTERAEHQDRPAITGLAQLDPLLDVGDREPLGPGLRERAGDGYGPVAVGVGLDDRKDARRGAGRRRPRRLRPLCTVGGQRTVIALGPRQVDPRRGAANHVPGARGMNLVCPAMKAGLDRAGRAVALLGDDQLGEAVDLRGTLRSGLYISSRKIMMTTSASCSSAPELWVTIPSASQLADAGHSQIEDVLLTRVLDRDDAVPEDVTGRQIAELVVVEPRRVIEEDGP